MHTDQELVRRFVLAYRSGGAEDVRVDVLCRASRSLDEERFDSVIWRCWRHGDLQEQRAVLRALPALREPARHLRIGREGARSNARYLFEAIAAGNPFPASWFDDEGFNQMVVKALFVGVPLAGVVGLEDRISATLRRMAADFAAERRAAGRPVPRDALGLEAGHVPGGRIS